MTESNGFRPMKLAAGTTARRSLLATAELVEAYAQITGDRNPLRFDGPGTVFLSQNWKFTAPVYIGDTIDAEAEVISAHEQKPVTQLRIRIARQDGQTVLEGEAWCYTMVPGR